MQGCGQWSIKFNQENCADPAPIVSLIYNAERPKAMWNIAPAVISGFCKSTSRGPFGAVNVLITVHVEACVHDKHQAIYSNVHTGRPIDVGQVTSSLLVEEYCPN